MFLFKSSVSFCHYFQTASKILQRSYGSKPNFRMAGTIEKEVDFQRMIKSKDDFNIDFQKLIHSFPKEAKANVKQRQDISKASIQETNSDLKKGKDSSKKTSKDGDVSKLKQDEISSTTTSEKANSKQQQDASKLSIQDTNTDLKIEEDSIMSSIERDYSSLKKENFSFIPKDDFNFDFQKLIHSFPKEAKVTNSDLKKGKDSSTASKDRDVSKLKQDIISSTQSHYIEVAERVVSIRAGQNL